MPSRREELVNTLRPVGLKPNHEPLFQVEPGAYEGFARDYKEAHVRVLAASRLLSWAQAELPAEMELEKASEKPPGEFQYILHALIAAAVLRKKYDVAGLARQAQQAPNRPQSETLQAALSTVANEPHKFIQATHALRKIDPRVAYFRPPEGYYEYWESQRAKQAQPRGKKTK